MKRKRTPEPGPVASDTVVPAALFQKAQSVFDADRGKKVAKCAVCEEECAPNSNEGLCWVCRRLKLSAWRDSDTQMPAQE